jgi:tRNA threonylcarbamoyladenosine biosynthesis protein TsaE
MLGRDLFEGVSLSELPHVAKEIARQVDRTRVWLFYGDLGSGKTTLIKLLGSALGVEDAMSSPTFSIVNEYHCREFGKAYHFDFYRIRSEMEALDIGIEEYFDSGYPCFIEWPEKIPSFLPEIRGEVTIRIDNETERTIAISLHVGKEKNRV